MPELQTILSVSLVMFLSTTVVRIAGFGGALVAMPLLVPLLGLQVASPLTNLIALPTFLFALVQQWREMTLADVWRMAIANILLAPLGIYLVYIIPEMWLFLSLGAVCMLYGLMRMANIQTIQHTNLNWAYFYGGISGLIGGAFNIGGPPAVLYADTRHWEPDRFRANMFSYFLVTSIFSIIGRYVAGQITVPVLWLWAFSLPAVFFAILTGQFIANRINKRQFQQIVFVLLIVLGTRLMWTAF